MPNRIGRFVLRVLGDTSDLSGELKNSEDDVSAYVKSWTRAGNLISAAIASVGVAAAGIGIANFISDTSAQINDLLNFSDVAAIAVQDLQAIELAGNRIGIEPDSIRDLITDISERVSEAVTLGTGEGVDVLDILGLDSNELLSQNAFDRFITLGQAIGNVQDEATQLQLVRQLSGSADEALRLLRNIDQINDAQQFLDDFNIGFDVGGIEAFREAQSEIADLSAIFGALRDQIVISVSPVIRELLELFKTEPVQQFVSVIFTALKNVDDFFALVLDRGPQFQQLFSSVGSNVSQFLGDLASVALTAVDAIFDRILLNVREATGLIGDFFALATLPLQLLESAQTERDTGPAFERLKDLIAGIQQDAKILLDVELSQSATQQFESTTSNLESLASKLEGPIPDSLKSFAESARQSLATPFDDLLAQTEQIQLALTAGLLDQGEANLLSTRVRNDYIKALEAAEAINDANSTEALVRGSQAEFSARNDNANFERQEALQRRAIADQQRAIKQSEESRLALQKAIEANTQEMARQRQTIQNDVGNDQPTQIIEIVPVNI